MKKILSLMLALVVTVSVFCTGVVADTGADAVIAAADNAIGGFFSLCEWMGGYFSEGESPDTSAIYQHFLWESFDLFGDYYVSDNEWGFCLFEIPAEVYEAEVFKVFGNEDAVREKLHAADFYKTDRETPYYSIEMGGGFGGYLPSVNVQGYTEGDDGKITAYAYICDTVIFDEDTYDGTDYVPAEDDVEGVDYIYILKNVYEYDEETGKSSVGTKYAPAKLVDGIRSVMKVNADQSVTFYSIERVAKEAIPAADDMITRENTKSTTTVNGAAIELGRDTFELGTTVYVEEYYENPEVDDDVFDIMADHTWRRGEICGIYEFKAMKDGTETQPIDGVNVSFVLPYDISPECAVFLIDDDGTVVYHYPEIDTDPSDPTVLYATLDMRCMGKYAVVGCRYGDVNKDSSVSLLDVSTMLKKVAGWDMGDLGSPADADRDGNLNLVDVTRILKYIAGWDVRFGENYKPAEPTPEPDFPEDDPKPVYKEWEIDENGVLLKYNGDDNVVTIPNGVTAIGAEVFKGKSMSYIFMPDSVTEMGEGAFMNCKNLFEINFSKNLKAIPRNAFLGSTVEYVEIPDSVTSIGAGAFSECYWIEDVIIPDSVTVIEDGAFDGFGESPYLIFRCSEGSAADEYSMKYKITCDHYYFDKLAN